jgi:HPr kinase/phosphorylase
MTNIHGTAVLYQEKGLLILGPPGAGKSELALHLIDRGAILIADDRVLLERKNGAWHASPAPEIAGLVELRGVGILRADFRADQKMHVMIAAPDAVVPPKLDLPISYLDLKSLQAVEKTMKLLKTFQL